MALYETYIKKKEERNFIMGKLSIKIARCRFKYHLRMMYLYDDLYKLGIISVAKAMDKIELHGMIIMYDIYPKIFPEELMKRVYEKKNARRNTILIRNI